MFPDPSLRYLSTTYKIKENAVFKQETSNKKCPANVLYHTLCRAFFCSLSEYYRSGFSGFTADRRNYIFKPHRFTCITLVFKLLNIIL